MAQQPECLRVIADQRRRSRHHPRAGSGVYTTADGYYDLALSGTGATGYTVTAAAVSGTSQANDTRCLVLGAQVAAGGNLNYGSGATTAAIDWTDANRCWAR